MKKEKTITVKALGVRYYHAIVEQRTGVKNSEYRGGRFYKSEQILGGGSGTLVTMPHPPTFILTIETPDGVPHPVHIDTVFKNCLTVSVLTSYIRRMIIETMPSTVDVVERKGHSDITQYVLSVDCARDWIRSFDQIKSKS